MILSCRIYQGKDLSKVERVTIINMLVKNVTFEAKESVLTFNKQLENRENYIHILT